MLINFKEIEHGIKSGITVLDGNKSLSFNIDKKLSPTIDDKVWKEGRTLLCVKHDEDVTEGVDWVKLTFIS